MNAPHAQSSKSRFPIRPWLAAAAVGGIVGLAIWPATPQQRFLAVALGIVSPVTAVWLIRLLVSFMIHLTAAVRRHNWRQFSLRGLLAFTIICAIASLIWSWTRPDIRYRRMREWQELAAAVELLGGSASEHGISLNGNLIGDSDLEYLASLPAANEVRGIELSGTAIVDGKGITDKVTKHLAHFPNLKNIMMNGCLGISDESLKPLHGNRKLRFLSVYDTRITEAGVKALKDSNHLLLVHLNPVFVKGDPNEKASVPAPTPFDY